VETQRDTRRVLLEAGQYYDEGDQNRTVAHYTGGQPPVLC